MLGFTQLGYERYLFDRYTFEGGIGVIGLGDNLSGFKQRGFNLRGGVKLIFWHREHRPLRGLYIKPELFYALYNKNILLYDNAHYDYYREKHQFRTIAAIFNIGYQFVFGNIITLDFNFGLGSNYCLSPRKQATYILNFDEDFMYGILADTETKFSTAVSGSMKLGIAF